MMYDTYGGQNEYIKVKTYMGFSQTSIWSQHYGLNVGYNIKWDGEGKQIKDKAQLVEKG